jgi:hypothetical protein
MDGLDVILSRHRAFDIEIQRNDQSVFSDIRKVERNAPFGDLLFTRNLLDQLINLGARRKKRSGRKRDNRCKTCRSDENFALLFRSCDRQVRSHINRHPLFLDIFIANL